MPRSSIVDSIVLPRLTANGALALGKQLIAAAEPYTKTQKLPKVVANGMNTLHLQWDELATFLATAPQTRENRRKTRRPKADRILDAGYGALFDFL